MKASKKSKERKKIRSERKEGREISLDIVRLEGCSHMWLATADDYSEMQEETAEV